MKLTKEECRNLFDDLERIVEVACESNECISCHLKRNGKCIKVDVEVGFEQLIKEHFELVSKCDMLDKALDKSCDELARQNDGEYWKTSEAFDTKED